MQHCTVLVCAARPSRRPESTLRQRHRGCVRWFTRTHALQAVRSACSSSVTLAWLLRAGVGWSGPSTLECSAAACHHQGHREPANLVPTTPMTPYARPRVDRSTNQAPASPRKGLGTPQQRQPERARVVVPGAEVGTQTAGVALPRRRAAPPATCHTIKQGRQRGSSMSFVPATALTRYGPCRDDQLCCRTNHQSARNGRPHNDTASCTRAQHTCTP